MAGITSTLIRLADELFARGLDSKSVQEELAKKVPAATESEIRQAAVPRTSEFTLQEAVDRSKLPAVVPGQRAKSTSAAPSYREIEDPAAQERVYEAYAQGARGESPAGEEAAGLEGLLNRPEITGRGFGAPVETPRRYPGTESLPPEYGTPSVSAPSKEPSRLSKLARPASIAGGATAIGLGASGYWGDKESKKEETKAAETTQVKDQKQADVQPTPGPGGKAGQVAPPQKKDGIPAAPGQEEKSTPEADDIETTLNEWGKLQSTLAAGKGVTREKLDGYLKQLDDLKPVSPSSPDTQRFVQARAEAYRAYQEKADRNDWLEVAQNLVGALTNYASARAAMGTRYEGGNIPLKGIDYGARTARAGKEYEMELGQIGAEERAAETAAEREDRMAREGLALKRGSLQEQIAAERERIREGEAAGREAGREARGILRDILTNRRYDRANQSRLAAETARLTAAGQKSTASELDKQIKSLEAEEKAVTNKLRAANNVLASNSKSYDKALAAYSTAAGVPESELQERADKEKGFLTSSSSYVKEKIVTPHVDELSADQQRLQQQIQDLRRARFGGQPAPAQQPAKASTTPVAGGKVISAAKLSAYANQFYNGDTTRARAYLAGQGYSFE